MSQELFTRKHVIDLLDNLLQYPDQLTDAIQNENTNWTAKELLELTESSLSPTPIEYEPNHTEENSVKEEDIRKEAEDYADTIINRNIHNNPQWTAEDIWQEAKRGYLNGKQSLSSIQNKEETKELL